MRIVTAVLMACLAWSASLQAQIATQGSAFTYQGEMHYLGQPVNDQCDLTFSIFDQVTGGVEIGIQTLTGVQIVDGTFSAEVDFGYVFIDIKYYLQIDIAAGCGAAGAGAETLARTAITSTPHSIYAQVSGFAEVVDWNSILGRPAGLDNGDDDTLYSAGAGLLLTGNDFSIDDSYRLPQTCANGEIAAWNGTTWGCAADQGSTNFWSLGGNTGTTAASNYLGTTDNQAFEIRVNNRRVLRIEPTTLHEPNIIGGYNLNSVAAGKVGATIAGGGSFAFKNSVGEAYGTVSGGLGNTATGKYATVTGGVTNSALGRASEAGGGGAVARLQGQQAYATERLSNIGLAQNSTYNLVGTTTSATPVALVTDPALLIPITIPLDMTMTFDIQVAATIAGAQDYFGYLARGVVQNDNNNIFLSLEAAPFSGGFGSLNWDVTISADSVGDSLKVQVTGEVGKTIRWVATVRTTEVSFQ